MELIPTDIIILINEDWVNSFTEVQSNKKAIAERVWLPYNQNLIIHKQLCDTTNIKYIEADKKGVLVPSIFIDTTSSI